MPLPSKSITSSKTMFLFLPKRSSVGSHIKKLYLPYWRPGVTLYISESFELVQKDFFNKLSNTHYKLIGVAICIIFSTNNHTLHLLNGALNVEVCDATGVS